jgi:hypothetical protein
MVFPKNMTLTERLNMLFPNEEAFMRLVEAHWDENEDDCRNISPRGSIPPSCFRMAKVRIWGEAAVLREEQALYGARVRPAKALATKAQSLGAQPAPGAQAPGAQPAGVQPAGAGE